MAIYDLLPKFYQMEVNNLKGLLPGFVVSQLPFKKNDELLKGKWNIVGSTSTSEGNYVANGHIVTISKDGIRSVKTNTAEDTEDTNATLFITYNDPMVKVGPRNAYRLYATNLEEEHVRAVQLIPGDEWMSDIDYFKKVNDAYVYPGAANLEGRIIKLAANDGVAKSDDWFAIDTNGQGTLPDGTKAFHYMFVK